MIAISTSLITPTAKPCFVAASFYCGERAAYHEEAKFISNNFKEIAAKIDHWAQQNSFIECVYFFGSRVRGDHKEGSDIDISIDPDFSCDNAAYWADWKCDPHYGGLQETLPGELDLLCRDAVSYSAIRQDDAQVVYQIGKVICIHLAPRQSE